MPLRENLYEIPLQSCSTPGCQNLWTLRDFDVITPETVSVIESVATHRPWLDGRISSKIRRECPGPVKSSMLRNTYILLGIRRRSRSVIWALAPGQALAKLTCNDHSAVSDHKPNLGSHSWDLAGFQAFAGRCKTILRPTQVTIHT